MNSLHKRYKDKFSFGNWISFLIVPTGVLLFWFLLIWDVRQAELILATYASVNIIYFLLSFLLKNIQDKVAGSWLGRYSYQLFIYTLILLLFAYPALASFHTHSGEETITKLKYNQLMFSRNYVAWLDWFKKNYKTKLEALDGAGPTGTSAAVYSLASQGMDIKESAEWNRYKIASGMKENEPGGRAGEMPLLDTLSQIKVKTLPIDFEPLSRILYLRRGNSSDPMFVWKFVNPPDGAKSFLELGYNEKPNLPSDETTGDVERFATVSEFKSAVERPGVIPPDIRVLLVALFLTIVLFALIHYFSKKIFLIDYEKCEIDADAENDLISQWTPSSGRYFILGKPGRLNVSNGKSGYFRYKDMEDVIAAGKISEVAVDDGRGIVIADFDYDMHNASSSLKKLELLERLILQMDGDVTVFSQFEPLQYFNLASPSSVGAAKTDKGQKNVTPEESEASGEELLDRWKRVLGRFSWKYLWPSKELQSPTLPDSGLTSESARSFYDSIWFASRREDKLVMIHLAQEGLVNAKDRETICRLLRRHLIKLLPTRLMSEGFRDYVRSPRT
jgi:hypothetical protein